MSHCFFMCLNHNRTLSTVSHQELSVKKHKKEMLRLNCLWFSKLPTFALVIQSERDPLHAEVHSPSFYQLGSQKSDLQLHFQKKVMTYKLAFLVASDCLAPHHSLWQRAAVTQTVEQVVSNHRCWFDSPTQSLHVEVSLSRCWTLNWLGSQHTAPLPSVDWNSMAGWETYFFNIGLCEDL